MPIITSAQNEALKHLLKLLNTAKYRRAHQQTVLEGEHLLETYLQTGQIPLQIWLPHDRNLHKNTKLSQLIKKLPEHIFMRVSESAQHKLTQARISDDLFALIPIPVSGSLPVSGDCVVLENLQDVGNVGTILRSAAASGIRQIILTQNGADVWSPKVLRASMGSHFSLNLHEKTDLANWLANYRERVIATTLSAQNPVSLYDSQLDLRQPSAWILGNEGAGISDYATQHADVCVHIPMMAQTESLNVAMAASICFFEQMRQRLAQTI